jgi:2,3-bisphosphoglycerate-independent phosphoglycerate mutase
MSASRVLLVFLDGVGIGDDTAATNPLAAAVTPALDALLDGCRLVAPTVPYSGARASTRGLDAVLGVDGLPQSGTGQAALLTGVNAAHMFGRHFGPYAPTAQRSLIANDSILARAGRAGRNVTFANAYLARLVALASAERPPLPMRASIVIAALGAGVLTRHEPELIAGDAIASEITVDGWRERLGRTDIPDISAEQAGRNLAAIANRHDLTLFAHYSTDAAGHLRDMDAGVTAWQRVDAFIGGLIPALGDDVLLAIVSDHGNLEDVRAQHTRNPALCILVGPGHAALAARLDALTDVAPVILGVLGIEIEARSRPTSLAESDRRHEPRI